MPRREDWEIEREEAMKKGGWRPAGLNRPVKVCPVEKPLEFEVSGYFTLGKHMLRKTPAEIERDPGLPHDLRLRFTVLIRSGGRDLGYPIGA
jgi:hypothetical protein